MDKKKLGVLVGPTASGKTALSIEIAKRIDAEILSADSIQLYRGFDIGSAKPTLLERQGIAHHLIDVYEPTEQNAGVSRFRELAAACIREISFRGKFPLVVGGTGLYINALTFPLSFAGTPSEAALRAELMEKETNSPGALYALLKELDTKSAERLHPNDRKRIVRALEVIKLTGKPMDTFGGDFENKRNVDIPYDVRIVGITLPRELLYERIERRVDEMMRLGLFDEVRRLREMGVTSSMPAMQGLGYKQLNACFEGRCTMEQAVEAIKLETRHFAKRQMTWFKRDTRIRWFDITQYESRERLLDELVAALNLESGGEHDE